MHAAAMRRHDRIEDIKSGMCISPDDIKHAQCNSVRPGRVCDKTGKFLN
jgi:hypothetical protein